jgi:malonyl CoA-acyl carrier protein transacylase
MAALRRFEPTTVLEVGPGRVLSGLARRVWPDLRCHPVSDAASIVAATEAVT